MIYKRGLSSVVTTALLLLLTITAVVIVASFVIPFVRDNLESTNCFEFNQYFKFDDSFDDSSNKFNCFDSGSNEYKISVEANGNLDDVDKIAGFNLRFVEVGTGNVLSLNVREGGSVNGLTMSGSGSPSLIIPRSGGPGAEGYSSLGYIYSSSDSFTKVDIHPVFIDGKVCDASDSVKIGKC